MENKIDIYKRLMNEFIVFRMEEELAILNELIRKNESKIKNNKVNLNFIYRSKDKKLEKEYFYKKDVFNSFVLRVEDSRILESNFESELDKAFFNDDNNVKKYCFFLQCYFVNLYSDSNYDERNKSNSLNEIIKALKLDKSILDFTNKALKKNQKIVETNGMLNMLNFNQENFNIDFFYPFASFLNVVDSSADRSILSNIIKENEIMFTIPNDKKIIDINVKELKNHLLIFLIIRDYLVVYTLKNGGKDRLFVSSFLKYKNEYEHLVLEKQVSDKDKTEKILLINKVVEQIGN